jgi:fructose-bisphosphate aldolase, class II
MGLPSHKGTEPVPLTSIVAELHRAQEGRYAVPLFDAADTHSTEGILGALEARGAPGIIALWAGLLDQPFGRALAAYVRTRVEGATVPVSLMLDHGTSFEHCAKAVSYGFTDVMYDGSRLPLAENAANTRAIVEAAHAHGVGVEAELGLVGAGSEYQTFGARRKGFTDPDSVAEFVAQTGVDSLAVAVGTAHGVYDGEPRVDLDLLGEIRSRTVTPLVLHGGSGSSEKQFRAVIAGGIAKINVATDLYATAGARLAAATREGTPSYFALTKAVVDSFRERCGYYLDLFGTTGKA